MNPVLLKGSTPPGGPYDLRVPAGKRDVVAKALAQTPKVVEAKAPAGQAVARERHVVQPRETLGGIARKHGVSVADLERWNGLGRTGVLRPGDRLWVAADRARVADVRAPGGSGPAGDR